MVRAVKDYWSMSSRFLKGDCDRPYMYAKPLTQKSVLGKGELLLLVCLFLKSI